MHDIHCQEVSHMDMSAKRLNRYFNGYGPVRPLRGLILHRLTLCVLIVSTSMMLMASCRHKDSAESPTSPSVSSIPELASTPYQAAGDVWVSARFSPEHQGIDFSARKDVPIRAAGAGVFHKNMYYHPGVPRWQVNAEISVGKGEYAIDCLFEPGNSVTEAQARSQFDMLVADGTTVKAGDRLGTLTLAPGNNQTTLHLGVRLTTTNPGTAYCPMPYCTASVRAALLNLYRRDNPGGQICSDHVY
jgi:hypothetical protein